MKKILLLTLFAYMGSASAQITITSTDMPVVNDTLRFSITTTTIDVSGTGSDHTWNYSGLLAEHQDIQHYYSPLTTPYVLQFGFNSTYGIAENNFGLGGIGGVASNVFGFYKNSAQANVLVGRGATVQGLPLGIVYAPKDTILKFPLNYLNSFSGNFKGEASLLGLGSLKQVGSRNTLVDGWGKITTPFGTFDCIRIKSVVIETDSIVFQGFGIPIPNNRTEYKWLAKNQHFPILEVIVNTGVGGSTQTIRYRDTYRPEAYVNNANFTASKTIIQNTDTINLTNQSYGTPKTYNWTINPGTYRFVGGTNSTSASPRVMLDINGFYTVKLAVTYEGGADDTIKSDYIYVGDGIKANFGASKHQTSPDELVYLLDSSAGNPTSWQWTVTPNSFSYAVGTGSRSQNPVLIFNSAGLYDVQLKVTGLIGTNTLVKPAYISIWTVGLNSVSDKNTFVKVYPNPGKDILKLEFANRYETNLQLLNLMGESILNLKFSNTIEKEVDLTAFPKGIYILKIIQNNSLFSERLVIE